MLRSFKALALPVPRLVAAVALAFWISPADLQVQPTSLPGSSGEVAVDHGAEQLADPGESSRVGIHGYPCDVTGPKG